MSLDLEAAIAAAVRAGVAPLVAKVEAQTAEIAALRAALPPALLRPDEVARRYGIPRSSQRRYISQGRLRRVKVGNTVLIDVSTLKPLDREEIAALVAEARR